MALNSKIEWTEATWNPLTGCDKCSLGCRHCYAAVMARRLRAMGSPKYAAGFELTLHEHLLEEPLKWKRPMKVFVNSMSDLFHEDVPIAFIRRVFDTMARADRHRFLVLTKRSLRLTDLSPDLVWPRNVWMGVTVEETRYRFRIDHLRQTGAHVKFLCLEPLLGPMEDLDLAGIDWVIAGGESGPAARAVNPDWVRNVRDQCVEKGVPFYFKHWGGRRGKKSGRTLDARTWDEAPAG